MGEECQAWLLGPADKRQEDGEMEPEDEGTIGNTGREQQDDEKLRGADQAIVFST